MKARIDSCVTPLIADDLKVTRGRPDDKSTGNAPCTFYVPAGVSYTGTDRSGKRQDDLQLVETVVALLFPVCGGSTIRHAAASICISL